MVVIDDQAFILLTYAGMPQKGGRRYHELLRERRLVSQALERVEETGSCFLIQEDIAPLNTLPEVLAKHSRLPISILHISGSYISDSTGLIPQTFTSLVGLPSNLKLVFLNGCATAAIIEALLLMDIPAVIATEAGLGESLPADFASAFYGYLSLGYTIKESFEAVLRLNKNVVNYYPINYNFEEDRLELENTLKLRDITSISWGLYYLSENIQKLGWKLPVADDVESSIELQAISLPEVVGPTNTKNFSVASRTLLIAGLLVSLVLMAGFILFRNVRDGVFAGEQTCEDEYNSLGLNVVILPFHSRDACKEKSFLYTKILQGKFEKYERLQAVRTTTKDINLCKGLYKETEHLLLRCYTDILIWGEYENRGTDSTWLFVNYMIPSRAKDSLKLGVFERVIPKLSEDSTIWEWSTDELNELVDQALGYAYYEREEYTLAGQSFLKIPFSNSPTYIPIAFKLANSYLEQRQYDLAESHFNHIIALDPENIPAYYGRGKLYAISGQSEKAIADYTYVIGLSQNYLGAYYSRGMLYLKEKYYDAAQEDMEKVLEMDPDFGNAYAVMAAVKAAKADEEDFYKYIEIALKQGVDISAFIAKTDVKNYYLEPRFRKLMIDYKVDTTSNL